MGYDSAFFDAGLDRRGVCSVKWEAPGVAQPGLIPLWVADMDFATAPVIVEALKQRAAHPNYGYTFVSDDCREALCGYWLRRHGVRLQPEEAMLLPSVVSGLRAGVMQFTAPGEGVIIQPPVYGPFFSAVTALGRRVMEAPLRQDETGRYHMDMDAVEKQLVAGARLMLLCNPHNPVSRCWSRQELEDLVALLSRYRCALVSDEIHADFVYQPRSFLSVMALPTPEIPLVSLVAASKTFNVAGLKQANLICRDGGLLRQISEKLEAHGVEAGNVFGLVATCAAYRQGDEWLDGLLRYLDGSRAVLGDALRDLLPQARLTPIEATFLAWVI